MKPTINDALDDLRLLYSAHANTVERLKLQKRPNQIMIDSARVHLERLERVAIVLNECAAK